jgi:glycosyltransferase involved in cell wall biosynthesis
MRVKVKVIIPAFNEEKAIASVIKEIPSEIVNEIIVVDNASSDNTSKVAEAEGATVLSESRKGYGWACLKGMEYISSKKEDLPDIVVFIDGDHSDFPYQIPQLIAPIVDDSHDFVVGSRALGTKERGSMTPQQIFGNWLATKLMKLIYGSTFTDLGPFRAIRFESLMAIGMRDKTFGWTVEMQIKALKHKLRVTEVSVDYRKRIGVSKVSGTVYGTIMAGYKIILTIFKYA